LECKLVPAAVQAHVKVRGWGEVMSQGMLITLRRQALPSMTNIQTNI
jgi:hypothetical protein